MSVCWKMCMLSNLLARCFEVLKPRGNPSLYLTNVVDVDLA